jgi:hypothetical protein
MPQRISDRCDAASTPSGISFWSRSIETPRGLVSGRSHHPLSVRAELRALDGVIVLQGFADHRSVRRILHSRGPAVGRRYHTRTVGVEGRAVIPKNQTKMMSARAYRSGHSRPGAEIASVRVDIGPLAGASRGDQRSAARRHRARQGPRRRLPRQETVLHAEATGSGPRYAYRWDINQRDRQDDRAFAANGLQSKGRSRMGRGRTRDVGSLVFESRA